jgi:hypothetical protein
VNCIRRSSILVALLCVSLLGGTARAAIVFVPEDKTFDFVSPDTYIVGMNHYGSPEQPNTLTSPTVTILEGANVGMDVYNGSTINMSGGHASISLVDQATATASGGTGGFRAEENSTITVSGGSFSLGASGNSTINVSGGAHISTLDLYGSSTANVSGGIIGSGGAWDIQLNFPLFGNPPQAGATANLTGGSVTRDVLGYGDSRITLDGFDVARDVIVRDRTTITITDGRIGRNLDAWDGIDVAVTGTPIGGSVAA